MMVQGINRRKIFEDIQDEHRFQKVGKGRQAGLYPQTVWEGFQHRSDQPDDGLQPSRHLTRP